MIYYNPNWGDFSQYRSEYGEYIESLGIQGGGGGSPQEPNKINWDPDAKVWRNSDGSVATDEQIDAARGLISMLDMAPEQDFSGFLGFLKFLFTEGYIDGYQYNLKGEAVAYRPMYIGFAPSVGIKGGVGLIANGRAGVYDLGTTLGKYVGQSKDIMGRVTSHFAKGGKLSAGELKNAIFHSMPGSTKLQREVYEQFLINKYGINNLVNVRNPMGGRMDLYNSMIDNVIKQFGLPR